MRRLRLVIVATIVVALLLLLPRVAAVSTQEFVPDYDYRIVKMQELDETWTIGVFKVWYYPNTYREMIYDVSDGPVAVRGSSKKEIKRELQIYADAPKRPTLVFSLVFPQQSKEERIQNVQTEK